MSLPSRALLVALLLLPVARPSPAQEPTPGTGTLTDEQQETFLRTARIVAKRSTNTGITDSIRATLTDGRLTHDAQVQSVDIAKPIIQTPQGTEINFKDTYRYNIAGYRLARLLGIEHVPVSVDRKVDGKDAAVTWWIDDVMMDEQGRMKRPDPMGPNAGLTGRQIYVMRVFDELIQNTDRNMGNILWTRDWTMWLIDHTRAFRFSTKLANVARLTRCDEVLLRGMRDLTLETLMTTMGRNLGRDEIRALLARRDLIVRHFDAKIAAQGYAAVVYSYLP